MRDLNRNKQRVWYAVHQGEAEIFDSTGLATGQYAVKYSDPKMVRLNVSAAQGDTTTRQFGEEERYDKVIVTSNKDLPIDEYSILWIDREPELDRNGHLTLDENENVVTPHDYIVGRVAKSLNSVAYAVRKVTVSG